MVATIICVVSYTCCVVFAVWIFIRKFRFYALCSSVMAVCSFMSAFFAAELIRQQVVEWGQMGASFGTSLLNLKLDVGAWAILVAGFILAGGYFISRQAPMTKAVEAPEAGKSRAEPSMMFCRECGSKIARDSKFCKECGAKLT